MLTPSASLLRHLRRTLHNNDNNTLAVRVLKPSNGNGYGIGIRIHCAATFSTAAHMRSGHSKWATIKHDKARADAKKNKQRSMLAQQIELVSRLYGPDPATNPRLKTTIADAKRQSLPKDVLESAIKRGQGLSTSGKPLEAVTIEALFPGGIAAIIECATESKARTLMEVRTILSKNGGSQGVVEYLFRRRGVVRIWAKQGSGEGEESAVVDELMDVQGVEDFEEVESQGETEAGGGGGDDAAAAAIQGETWEMYCSPSAVKSVADAAELVEGVQVKGMEILWQPVDHVEAGEEDGAVVEACVEKLEELTEVRQVYLNMAR